MLYKFQAYDSDPHILKVILRLHLSNIGYLPCAAAYPFSLFYKVCFDDQIGLCFVKYSQKGMCYYHH